MGALPVEGEKMNTIEIYEKMYEVVRNKANIATAKQAWRVRVKEEIDDAFGEEVPWELCDSIMNIEWEDTIMRECWYEFTKKLRWGEVSDDQERRPAEGSTKETQ